MRALTAASLPLAAMLAALLLRQSPALLPVMSAIALAGMAAAAVILAGLLRDPKRRQANLAALAPVLAVLLAAGALAGPLFLLGIAGMLAITMSASLALARRTA